MSHNTTKQVALGNIIAALVIAAVAGLGFWIYQDLAEAQDNARTTVCQRTGTC